MKLYGHSFSTCTRKVLITLAEKGHEAQFINIDLSKGEQKSPPYLTKHPFGVVPCLDDNGFILYESRAICRYLDAKFSNTTRLVPMDLTSLAKMEQWISVEQSYVSPAIGQFFVQKVLKPMRGQETDLLAVESAKKDAHFVFDIINKELGSKPYLAGEQFTLADVFMMPYHFHLISAKETQVMEAYPHLMNWWKRVSERPSWKQFS